MFFRVSMMQKMLFTRELALYLKSAVPLNEALESLGQHEKLPGFKGVIGQLRNDIENGQSFAHALARHPKVFDNLYVSLVSVGEASGTLSHSLEHLADFLERSYALRKKVGSIFLYPSMIIFSALALGGFITVYILPQLVRLFGSFHIELPLATKILLGFAELVERHGLVVLGGIAIFVIGLRFLLAFGWAKRIAHRTVLALPIVGPFLRQYYLAAFFHDIGVLLRSGMPIAEVFLVEEKAHRNVVFSALSADLGRALQSGKELWQEIELHQSSLFPPLVAKMIAAGERSGKLEETFFYLSDFFDAEVDRAVKNFTILLEPFLLIVIGAIVAFLAVAILAPIYSLSGSIHR
ncbi:MAG: type II secretion system F family protein [Candidatus Moraniibacteriota bacterium]|nr:MAG: type II secretion system F family protein [Candidatus Moranbacteria bacterium]